MINVVDLLLNDVEATNCGQIYLSLSFLDQMGNTVLTFFKPDYQLVYFEILRTSHLVTQ